MPTRIRLFLAWGSALLLLGAAALPAHAGEEGSGNAALSAYRESADPMGDVQQALDEAKSADKLLLIVMGAQWCHDSRGLAEKFQDPSVAKVLADSYQTVFVDVGYYKDLRAISRRFDQPHYFATPTVMIVNAQTERLINASDMHIWGSADQLPIDRYVDYFSAYAGSPSPAFSPLPPRHATAISAFEEHNAQRLTEAYAVLVPGMQLEDRTGQARAEFLQQWREVQRYRSSLQKDIQAVRQQAILAPDEPLEFPVYERFSWED